MMVTSSPFRDRRTLLLGWAASVGLLLIASILSCQGARFRTVRQDNAEDTNTNTTVETVMITGEEKTLPRDLLEAIARSAAKAGVRGGHSPAALLLDDANPATTSLIGKEPTELLEPWHDKGLAVVKQVSFSQAAEGALNAISASSFQTTLTDLVASADTRFLFSSGNIKARAFMMNELKKILGDNMVSTESFDVTFGGLKAYRGKGVNVIGELKGTEKPDEYVLLGAHYDSVPDSGPAPGADDNGSGATALLLAAKALKQFPHKRSILFVSFSGEEEGLLGSSAFVQSRLAEGAHNFKGAIIMDQVGFTKDRTKPPSLIFETKGVEDSKQRLIDTMALTTKSVLPEADFQVNYHGWGSDHMPFIDAGHPAVLLIERDNLYSADHFGHTVRDVIDNVDFAFGAKVAKLAAASVANLASPDTL